MASTTSARTSLSLTGERALPKVRTPSWVQTAQFLTRPDLFLEQNWRRYGDVFRASVKGFGTGRHVVVSDPRYVERLFKASPADVRLGEVAKKPLVPIAGPNSLLVLDQPEHLRHRKLLLPHFHGQRMLAYADIVKDATERSIRQWPVDQPFALRPHMANITLEVILRAVFGVEHGRRYEELRRQLIRIMDDNLPVVLALVFPALRRDFGPVRSWSTLQDAKAKVDAILYDEIANRRRSDGPTGQGDILSMLIDARDAEGDGLTDEELRDELITMLLAGHETTGSSLAWAFDLLLHHPTVLHRLRDELVAGETDYLDAVVSEALRVRPVVVTSQRILTAPQSFDGVEIEAGTTVLASIWVVNRRPDLYEDPASFKPERFLGQRPGTYEWIPFGGGVRRCIGANFAPMEMREVIKHVVLSTDLAAAKPDLEKPHNRVVLVTPRNGTMVTFGGRRGGHA